MEIVYENDKYDPPITLTQQRWDNGLNCIFCDHKYYTVQCTLGDGVQSWCNTHGNKEWRPCESKGEN